jgi:hypothetical protein
LQLVEIPPELIERRLQIGRFGGEAVSLAINYTNKEEFAAAGYAPFMVDGIEYGEVRQHGNFSFLRVYEVSCTVVWMVEFSDRIKSGHLVPYYQPEASLEMFRRTLLGLDIASGNLKYSGNYSTTGSANSTHTESFVPLPSTTSSAATPGIATTTAAAHVVK